MANEIQLVEGIDKKHKVVFKGSEGKHVGEMDQSQLRTLAKIGLESGDKSILKLFKADTLPTLAELKKDNTAKELNKLDEKQSVANTGAANTGAAGNRPAGAGQGQ